MSNQKRRKIAVLTEAEDRAWNRNYSFFIVHGFTDKEADERTWHDMKREFPRLRNYQGCK